MSRPVRLAIVLVLAACASTKSAQEDSYARQYWPQPRPALPYPTVVIEEGGRPTVEGTAVYEVGSRLDPHIVLRLPPAPRREVERYVRCCVVVDRRR